MSNLVLFRRGRRLALVAIAIAVAVMALLAGAGPAPALEVGDDKAEFLARTGAASATGPLPDLGGSVPSTGPVTVGSVTFALAPGGNSLAVGASGYGIEDWYPGTAGNDLAMGLENLEVRLGRPVHALGFDLVEPAATMPPWGASPVDSTFEVTLLAGDLVVGEAVFDAPDDVLAFQGVWSDVAFDRAWIVDTTGSHDDEYFGEFYTGTIPGPPTSTTLLAATGAPVPGGQGAMTGFAGEPAGSGGAAAFVATGSLGSSGVYLGRAGSTTARVADLGTAVPGGTGTFTAFGDVALAGDRSRPEAPPIRVAFLAAGTGQQGVYASALDDRGIPGNPVRVADRTTAVPGGTGTFTGFTELALVAKPEGPPIRVAFVGTGGDRQGVYVSSLGDAAIPGNPVRVADTASAIPGGTGTFTAFGDLAIAARPEGPPIRVAFVGTGGDRQGVYVSSLGDAAIPGNPVRVADTASAIPGGTGTFTAFGDLAMAAAPEGLQIRVAFVGTGAGRQGVYAATLDETAFPEGPPIRVADTTTPIPGGTGAFTGFGAVSVSPEHVAFVGEGTGGQRGIYLASTLTEVIAAGDPLDGRTVTGVSMGSTALDGRSLVFTASFADGSSGVYVAGLATYPFVGFEPPVDNPPVVNTASAGSAIPVRFSLHGDRGLAVLVPGSPWSQPVACDTGAPLDTVEETVTAGASALAYDAPGDRYTYVWKTSRAWAGTCRRLTVALRDGTRHDALFSLR